MTRDIVCFANSRKMGGRCFAGKCLHAKEWIRPVYKTERLGIREHTQRYKDESIPQLLDIVRVPLETTFASSYDYQPENALLSSGRQWEKMGQLTWAGAQDYVDKQRDHLWLSKNDKHLFNDRISQEEIASVKTSICLIRVFNIRIDKKSYVSRKEEPILRVKFAYKNKRYDLRLTALEECFQEPQDIKEALLCISLGTPFRPDNANKDFVYKLVSGIITP